MSMTITYIAIILIIINEVVLRSQIYVVMRDKLISCSRQFSYANFSWFSVMAKVYPKAPISALSYMTSKRETFTVWMKSLVCHSNGCTVFNSNGEIVYRVENYDKNCSNEVYLMDLRGNVIFTIRRRVCN